MKILTVAISAFLVCLVSGLIGIRLAPRLGLLDIPGGRRQHKSPVPRVGGLAVVASFLVVSAMRGFHFSLTWLEIGAVSFMAVLGFLDDRMELRARWKAILGLLVAIILAAGATYHLAPRLTPYEVLGVMVPPTAWIAFSLLVALFWCLPHAFNLIDGANGLASGYGLVVVGSLWAMGIPNPMVGGTLLACLLLNWPKARLFLGDCGSLSIGLLLVIAAQKAIIMPHPNHLMWLFAYPVMDVVTVIVIRLLTRKPVTVGDRNHLHYQISDRWPALSHFSVPLLLALAALCGSELYIPREWMVLPYAGLLGLLALSAFFTVASILPFLEDDSSFEELHEQLQSVTAGPGHPPPEHRSIHHEPKWQKNLTVLGLLAILFDFIRK